MSVYDFTPRMLEQLACDLDEPSDTEPIVLAMEGLHEDLKAILPKIYEASFAMSLSWETDAEVTKRQRDAAKNLVDALTDIVRARGTVIRAV